MKQIIYFFILAAIISGLSSCSFAEVGDTHGVVIEDQGKSIKTIVRNDTVVINKGNFIDYSYKPYNVVALRINSKGEQLYSIMKEDEGNAETILAASLIFFILAFVVIISMTTE